MSIQGNGNHFNPSRVIVLSELSTREKEKYYQLLLSNKAKFHRDANGRYVASIRLLAPGVKKEVEIKRVLGTAQKESLPLEDRLNRLQQEFVTVRISGVESFDYTPYNRFTLLIAVNGEVVRPKPQSLFWLMKRIESLYDARFLHEKMDVERDDISLGDNANLSSIFPLFVVKRLSTEKGLIKTIVDQNCWDLLYNVHVYRHDYLEVEIFARFLQEFYDNDDLLFYLYVRSVISKVLNVSFKSRWGKADGPARQPKGMWMSFRECVQVARIVFGATNETMWRRFLEIIQPQMVGQKTDTIDSRRIDITQFLHLAVVGYHQTQPSQSDNRSNSTGGIRSSYRTPGLESEEAAPGGLYEPAMRGRGDVEMDDDAAGMPMGQQQQQQYAPQYQQQQPWVQNSGYLQDRSYGGNEGGGRDGELGTYREPDADEFDGEGDGEGEGEEEKKARQYGSSLDVYLAALAGDSEDDYNSVSQLLSGTPKTMDVYKPVPISDFVASSASPWTGGRYPMYGTGTGQEEDEEEEDMRQERGYSDVDFDASGRVIPKPLSPGAAAAMAKAYAEANAAGSATRRGDHSPMKTGVQIIDRDLEHPTAVFSVSAPAIPSIPRLHQPAVNPAPYGRDLVGDPYPSARKGPGDNGSVNSWIDESGNWQEEEPEPAPPARVRAAPAPVPVPAPAPAPAPASVYFPAVSADEEPTSALQLLASQSDEMAYRAADSIDDIRFDDYGIKLKDFARANNDDEEEAVARADAAAATADAAARDQHHRGLLNSYNSGYGFAVEELAALRDGAVADDEADGDAALLQQNTARNSNRDPSSARSDVEDAPSSSGYHQPSVSFAAPASASASEHTPVYEDEQQASYGAASEPDMEQDAYVQPDVTAAAAGQDQYASLQLDREREFLSFLCEPLAELPENIAEDMVGELADQLRAKLNAKLEGHEVASIDVFDAVLLEHLQSDSLRLEMEGMRDSMLNYLFAQIEEEQQKQEVEGEGYGEGYEGGYEDGDAPPLDDVPEEEGGEYEYQEEEEPQVVEPMSSARGTYSPLSKRIFDKYDVDKSGYVSIDELQNMAASFGVHLSGDALTVAMMTLDSNGDGQISYEEFVNWHRHNDSFGSLSLDADQLNQRLRVMQVFQKYDTDNSGALSRDEFSGFYEELNELGLVRHSIEKVIEDIDYNQDGVIQFNELAVWMERQK